MNRIISDFFLYFKYHFWEVRIIKGSSFSYKVWALKRFLKMVALGRTKSQTYYLPSDIEIENSFGRFFIPKNSDLVLTVSSKSEADLLKYFYVAPGKIFLDIGANAGKYSVYIGNNSKNSEIYSFEPSPSTFQILKKNVEINNLSEKVHLLNIGLSSIESELKFANSKSATGLSTFVSDDYHVKFNPEWFEFTTVKVDSLDNVVRKAGLAFSKIELLKIDVENHERSVVAGAAETLTNLSPGSRILIEIFPDSKDLEFILNFIVSRSFRHDKINEEYHLFTKI